MPWGVRCCQQALMSRWVSPVSKRAMAAKPTSVPARQPCRDRERRDGIGPSAHRAALLTSGQLLSSSRAKPGSFLSALQPNTPTCTKISADIRDL